MTTYRAQSTTPAIVVAAYNRPHSLRRILRSIGRGVFDQPVDLVISIDKSDSRDVERLAQEFPWPYGTKHVRPWKQHLGLKQHVLNCGDLSQEFGSIILLEDDLFVSPYFHRYSCLTLDFYAADPNVAGIALYSHRYNETSGLGFRPLDDDSDVFFAQVPCSWGQCWTDLQWKNFRVWLTNNPDQTDAPDLRVPTDVLNWSAASWKKHFFRYMVAANKYFVYPRTSLTTNFADAGVHHDPRASFLQTPLLVQPNEFRYVPLSDSVAVYDAFLEILPDKLVQLAPHLRGQDFAIDLYGTKPLQILDRPYVLTVRDCSEPEATFGRELKPIELNVCFEIEGTTISLTDPSFCSANAKRRTRHDVAYFHDLSTRLLKGSKWTRRAGDLLRFATHRPRRAA